MREKFSIRLISVNEIPEVTNWAKLEGFSPGMDDVSIYRNTDKQGIWVACIDNNPIGSIACIKYNSSYGFIGLFIVKKEFRNNGYGVRLWKHALEYLKNVDCIGLEAAPDRLNDLLVTIKLIYITFKNSNFSWLIYFYEGKVFN